MTTRPPAAWPSSAVCKEVEVLAHHSSKLSRDPTRRFQLCVGCTYAQLCAVLEAGRGWDDSGNDPQLRQAGARAPAVVWQTLPALALGAASALPHPTLHCLPGLGIAVEHCMHIGEPGGDFVLAREAVGARVRVQAQTRVRRSPAADTATHVVCVPLAGAEAPEEVSCVLAWLASLGLCGPDASGGPPQGGGLSFPPLEFPLVRDLEWCDWTWGGALFGPGRDWCVKAKPDGVRCLFLYQASSGHVVRRELGGADRLVPVTARLARSFILDTELLTDGGLHPIDLPFLDSWLTTLDLPARCALLPHVLPTLPYRAVILPWARVVAPADVPAIRAAPAFVAAFADALEGAARGGIGVAGGAAAVPCDGVVACPARGPWQLQPPAHNYINAYKLKAPDQCTLDLAVFPAEGRVYAADFLGSSSCSSRPPTGPHRDLARLDLQPGTSWHALPGFIVPPGAAAGEVWEFSVLARSPLRHRPAKFMRPNSMGQVIAVHTQALMPISAASLRRSTDVLAARSLHALIAHARVWRRTPALSGGANGAAPIVVAHTGFDAAASPAARAVLELHFPPSDQADLVLAATSASALAALGAGRSTTVVGVAARKAPAAPAGYALSITYLSTELMLPEPAQLQLYTYAPTPTSHPDTTTACQLPFEHPSDKPPDRKEPLPRNPLALPMHA